MTAADPVPDELPGPDAADLHTTAGKIADLGRRRHEAVHAGSAAAVDKQHARGKLTARERIGLLHAHNRMSAWVALALRAQRRRDGGTEEHLVRSTSGQQHGERRTVDLGVL